MNSPDDESPPPVPPRDPLLDDPLFAEIVELKPAPSPAEPVYAQPVEAAPADDLPVAELAPTVSRPKAVPIQPAVPPKPPGPAFPPSKPVSLPVPVETEPPKPQWFAACSVIGCLGVLLIAAVAALIWIAITLLSGLGEKLAEQGASGHTKDGSSKYSRKRPGAIEPTQLTQNTRLEVPGRIGSIGLGANGRFLLIGKQSRKEIAAFDVNSGTFLWTAPVDELNSAFAASASKLFVLNRVGGKIVRYDLASGEREFEAPLPKGSLPDALAIGAGVEGPLYAITTPPNRPAVVDSYREDTLTPITSIGVPDWKCRDDRRALIRATFDGEQLGAGARDGALSVRPIPSTRANAPPQAVLLKATRGSSLFALPSPDGEYFYTPRGVFSPDGRRLYSSSAFTLPAAQGSGLYVSLAAVEDQITGSPRIHAAGDDLSTPLITLDESLALEGDLPAYEMRSLTLPVSHRVHVWPAAGLVAIIPFQNDRLQLYKVDFGAQLRDASREFLAFGTDPVLLAEDGVEWRYTPKLFSRDGKPPRLELENGPPSMKLVEDTLIWTPQPGVVPEVRLKATANKPGGRVARQSFTPVIVRP